MSMARGVSFETRETQTMNSLSLWERARVREARKELNSPFSCN